MKSGETTSTVVLFGELGQFKESPNRPCLGGCGLLPFLFIAPHSHRELHHENPF